MAERVQDLLEQSSVARQRRQHATRQKMEEIGRRLKHVAFAMADWKLRYVIPRLQELGRMFANSSEPVRDAECDAVCIKFHPIAELPVEARLAVRMTPDPLAENIRVSVTALIMPVTAEYEREAWLDVPVHAPDTKLLQEFIDARIVRFVADYLRILDPASPFQSERVATDPVCLMTIPIVDAAGSTVFKEHTYYFCIEECRRKFEADPDRYVRVVEKRRL